MKKTMIYFIVIVSVAITSTILFLIISNRKKEIVVNNFNNEEIFSLGKYRITDVSSNVGYSPEFAFKIKNKSEKEKFIKNMLTSDKYIGMYEWSMFGENWIFRDNGNYYILRETKTRFELFPLYSTVEFINIDEKYQIAPSFKFIGTLMLIPLMNIDEIKMIETKQTREEFIEFYQNANPNYVQKTDDPNTYFLILYTEVRSIKNEIFKLKITYIEEYKVSIEALFENK